MKLRGGSQHLGRDTQMLQAQGQWWGRAHLCRAQGRSRAELTAGEARQFACVPGTTNSKQGAEEDGVER